MHTYTLQGNMQNLDCQKQALLLYLGMEIYNLHNLVFL